MLKSHVFPSNKVQAKKKEKGKGASNTQVDTHIRDPNTNRKPPDGRTGMKNPHNTIPSGLVTSPNKSGNPFPASLVNPLQRLFLDHPVLLVRRAIFPFTLVRFVFIRWN